MQDVFQDTERDFVSSYDTQLSPVNLMKRISLT